MRRLLSFLGALSLLAGAQALAVATAAPEPRFRSQLVFGDDPCPKSSDDEIVVCARQPESERYRIPKKLRDEKRDREAANQAWGSRVATLEMVSRAGLPNSCSPVGSGGQTGCYRQFLQQFNAQKRQDAEDAASVP